MPVSRLRVALSVTLSALAVSALALVLSGCGAKEPAFDMSLGSESDQAIYVTNASGHEIVGISLAEEGADDQGNLLDEGASFADGQVAKIFIPASGPGELAESDGAVVEDSGEGAAEEAAGEPVKEAPEAGAPADGSLVDGATGEAGSEVDSAKPAPLYNIQVTFEDGTTATLYGLDPRSVNEFSLCYEDEVAFITYTDDEGNEVDTKDLALEIKAEQDRIAAEEAAAAEAAALAAQQQNYYANPYGADTSASQGQSGCLGF